MPQPTDNPVDGAIVRFIGRHHVLTLATTGVGPMGAEPKETEERTAEERTAEERAADGAERKRGAEVPWCCNLFYAYDKVRNRFIFSSGPETRHGQELKRNSRVAASIVLETRVVGRVQGLQITGEATPADEAGRGVYLKRFPYAAVLELNLWQLSPDCMKLTDNTLGFGKKLIWRRS